MRAFQKGVTRVVLHPLERLQVQDGPTSPCGESNAGEGICQDCAYVRHGRLEIRADASAGAVGGSAEHPSDLGVELVPADDLTKRRPGHVIQTETRLVGPEWAPAD